MQPFAPEPTPEFRLVTECIKWPSTEAKIEKVHRAAAQPLDWSALLGLAKHHQVIGLVYDSLRSADIEMPTDVAQTLQSEAGMLVRKDLALAAEASRLQRLLNETGVPALFVKGTSLSLLAYGKLGLRGAKDIDILVPRRLLGPAAALLNRTGYERADPPADISDDVMRLIMPLRKDFGYVHGSRRFHIELHWRLFLNPHAMDESSVFSASQFVPITKSTGLRTLGQEDLLTYLCVHGARHWWYQLKWLADVNALLVRSSESLDQLYRATKARGGGRAAAQAMLLCQNLLDMYLPSDLSQTLRSTPNARWLQKTALNAVGAGKSPTRAKEAPFATTRRSLSVLLLNEGWRYRLAELRQLFNNTGDVLMLPLPKSLSFLYPALRIPLWVWRNIRLKSAGRNERRFT